MIKFRDWLKEYSPNRAWPVEEKDFNKYWQIFTANNNDVLTSGRLSFIDGKVSMMGMSIHFDGYRNINITE